MSTFNFLKVKLGVVWHICWWISKNVNGCWLQFKTPYDGKFRTEVYNYIRSLITEWFYLFFFSIKFEKVYEFCKQAPSKTKTCQDCSVLK